MDWLKKNKKEIKLPYLFVNQLLFILNLIFRLEKLKNKNSILMD